jgi:predicted nucleotidyltransferase component of viral defense system
MREPARNIAASIRARLLMIAKERNQPLDLLLTRYVLERLLHRLSVSEYRERFVLKGAMLVTTWIDAPYRPTRDLDLLGFGTPDPDAILSVFREICAIRIEDGVEFDVAGLHIDRIREEFAYGGLHVKTGASLAGARVRVRIDIGFGDAVEPEIVETELPVLLDLPSPRLRTYPPETVIAEKFQAMVVLGLANSRMKDLYDIWVLCHAREFAGPRLAQAIAATFSRRNTPVPDEPPVCLTRVFAEDRTKRQQWTSFLERIEAPPADLAGVIDDLSGFLMRHAAAARAVDRLK